MRRQKEVIVMTLLNAFLSYFILVLVFIAVAGIAIALGINLRKRKDAQDPDTVQTKQ